MLIYKPDKFLFLRNWRPITFMWYSLQMFSFQAWVLTWEKQFAVIKSKHIYNLSFIRPAKNILPSVSQFFLKADTLQNYFFVWKTLEKWNVFCWKSPAEWIQNTITVELFLSFITVECFFTWQCPLSPRAPPFVWLCSALWRHHRDITPPNFGLARRRFTQTRLLWDRTAAALRLPPGLTITEWTRHGSSLQGNINNKMKTSNLLPPSVTVIHLLFRGSGRCAAVSGSRGVVCPIRRDNPSVSRAARQRHIDCSPGNRTTAACVWGRRRAANTIDWFEKRKSNPHWWMKYIDIS